MQQNRTHLKIRRCVGSYWLDVISYTLLVRRSPKISILHLNTQYSRLSTQDSKLSTQKMKPITPREAFIKANSALFWHIPAEKKSQISDDVLVEYVLNYGSWKQVQELMQVLGLRVVARIFSAHTAAPRHNYFREIVHYFTLYFKKHAVSNS